MNFNPKQNINRIVLIHIEVFESNIVKIIPKKIKKTRLVKI